MPAGTVGDLRDMPELMRARGLQYPVARAVRALQTARTPKERYDALIDVTDALCITVAVSAIAWLRTVEPDSPAFAELAEAYRSGVSQGTWVSIARRAAGTASRFDGLPAGFAAGGRKGKNTLIKQIETLNQERNRWAHGGAPRTSADAAHRLDEFTPVLASALTSADYLRELPWIGTLSSSYRARQRTFDVTAFSAMNDHPEFERRSLELNEPLPDSHVFQLVGGRPIDLTPFVLVRDCIDCRRPELFYADRVQRDGPAVLKSFGGTGHQMTDRALVEDITSLATP